MKNYQCSLVIGAKPAAVFAALTTVEGLRGWWTQDCTADSDSEDSVTVRFGRTHKDLRIESIEADREVQWLCTGSQIAADSLSRCDEWVGTRLVFRLAAQSEARTRLDFEHIGLVPAMQCYEMCCDGWRYYLDSLQRLLESGQGTPYELPLAATA